MDGFGLRLSRAVVFAAVSVLLAVGARLVVTGLPVPLDVVGMAFGLSLGVAMILFASGERRYPAIIALMVPVQVGLTVVGGRSLGQRDRRDQPREQRGDARPGHDGHGAQDREHSCLAPAEPPGRHGW